MRRKALNEGQGGIDKMGKLNKGLAVGKTQTISVRKRGGGTRRVTFKRIALKGFPQWRIMKTK